MANNVYRVLKTVVDDRDFKLNSDEVRASRLVGDSGDTSALAYDSEDGSIDNTVTEVVMALRSGKLDKADVATLKRELDEQYKEGVSVMKETELEQARALARDTLLGVRSATQDSAQSVANSAQKSTPR